MLKFFSEDAEAANEMGAGGSVARGGEGKRQKAALKSKVGEGFAVLIL